MRSRLHNHNLQSIVFRVRPFSTQTGSSQSPVIFINRGSSSRINSILGPSDRQFPFPGDVSHLALRSSEEVSPRKSELLTRSIGQLMSVSQVQADAEFRTTMVMEEVIEITTNSGWTWTVELKAQKCPRLLMRDLSYLFPDIKIAGMTVNLLNFTYKTQSDMATWNKNMNEERENLSALFISSAMTVSSILQRNGYWVDFIDPSSGRPYLGHYTNHTLFETNDAYKEMGFQIEDLGCCKVRLFLFFHRSDS